MCCLWWSLAAAWYTLSAVDFAFPWLYEVVGVGKNVTDFGPKNHFKRGFELTDRREHERLFGQIVRAINNGGVGLAQIEYRDPSGTTIDTLLRPPEVTHLQDVADLLARLRHVSWYVAGMALLLGGIQFYRRWVLPAAWRVGLVVIATIGVVSLGLALLGPTRIFYALHTQVFPANHQWFFYYQESLMTTLMKAPDLFGYIAVLLGLLVPMWFVILWAGWRRIFNRIVTTGVGNAV